MGSTARVVFPTFSVNYHREPRRFDDLLAELIARNLGLELCPIHPIIGDDTPRDIREFLGESKQKHLYDSTIIIVDKEGAFVIFDNQDGPSNSYVMKDHEGFRGAWAGQYSPKNIELNFGEKAHLIESGAYLDCWPDETRRMREEIHQIWNSNWMGLEKRVFFSGNITKWSINNTDGEDGYRRGCALALRDLYPKEFAIFDGLLPREQWMRSAGWYRLNLCLPLGGNYSWRNFELYGLGCPTLEPEHVNVSRYPLIPDVHYVSVPGIKYNIGGQVDEPPEEAAKKIVRRYREVIDDMEYLREVSQASYDWYTQYCDLDFIAQEFIDWTAKRLSL